MVRGKFRHFKLHFISLSFSAPNNAGRILKVEIGPKDVHINPASSLLCQVFPVQTQKYTPQRFPL